MSYYTGVGGWAFEPIGDGIPPASYYAGPANTLRGAVGGFAASVMFAGRALAAPPQAGALFSNYRGNPFHDGWAIQVNASAGGLNVAALLGVTASTVTAEAVSAVVPLARPFNIATLVFNGTNELRLYLNGTTKVVAAVAAAYGPAAVANLPAIGLRSVLSGFPAIGQYILGAAYVEAVPSDEAAFRHQLVCLQAGDMVDGSIGSAFSAPTGNAVQVFSNLYSAARGNNGIGVPVSAYVGGSQGGETLGVLPPAVPVWLDEKTPQVNFTKVITTDPPAQLFTTGFKRVG